MTNFEWDKEKKQRNIEVHGFGFDRAKQVFNQTLLVRQDLRRDYGEIRYIGVEEMEDGVIIAIVYTIRDHKTRIISARVASRKERSAYYEYTRKNI